MTGNRFQRITGALLLALILECAAARASTALILEGQKEYDAGDYAAAAAAFEKHVQDQGPSAAMFYNLGNAYFRAGKLGESMLWYRRAWLLEPHDPDVRANIAYATQQAGVQWPEGPVLVGLLRKAPASFWLWALIACFWGGTAWVLRRIFRPQGLRYSWPGFIMSWVGVMGLCGLGIWAGYQPFSHSEVVNTKGRIEARFGPIATETVHFSMPSGQVSEVLERRGRWLRVQAGKDRGWVQEEDVTLVYPWNLEPR